MYTCHYLNELGATYISSVQANPITVSTAKVTPSVAGLGAT